MPQPVEALVAARRALVPGGAMIVMDEAVADEFTAPGDEVERLMYGFSLTICLPDGMSHPVYQDIHSTSWKITPLGSRIWK